MKYDSHELGQALAWYRKLQSSQTYHIRAAMRNLDNLKLDSTMVLIAAYRYATRVIENSVPYIKK